MSSQIPSASFSKNLDAAVSVTQRSPISDRIMSCSDQNNEEENHLAAKLSLQSNAPAHMDREQTEQYQFKFFNKKEFDWF